MVYSDDYRPGYLALYQTGELQKRADRLTARLEHCDICPRQCGINRLQGDTGFCRSGSKPIVASVCAHYGEEPPLSGTRGSGTIFFGNCNLHCAFCQNFQISQDPSALRDKEVGIEELAEYMLYLQDSLKCHNINLVTPTHFVPQILQALVEAVPHGLVLPLVYNTSGYDAIDVIRELDDIISIYLPDIRYADNWSAIKYSQAKDYVESDRRAIREMFRQVGRLVIDDDGIARRGLIVRHLILPGNIAGSADSLRWLAENISPAISVSVMSQYHPAHLAKVIPFLSRPITPAEYYQVKLLLDKLGMENGWVQEMNAADYYLPDFARNGHPFENDSQ